MPDQPIYIAEIPNLVEALRDGGLWIWFAAAWLLFVALLRGTESRRATWPIVVMVWSFARAVDLKRFGLDVHAHGLHQWSFFSWFELVNTAWQALLLLSVLVVGAAVDRRAVSFVDANRSGVFGALAGVAGVLYCWFSIAVASAGPVLAEALARQPDS